jgi:transglutaminase-like putative cysteine protease
MKDLKKTGSKIPFKLILGVIVVIVVIFDIFLLRGSNALGSQNTPYNATFGYQGQGYYAYKGREFYANSSVQLISALTSNPTTTSTIAPTTSVYYTTSTQQTTSIYYTTSVYYTTTVPQYYTTTIYNTNNYGCSPLPCTYIRNGNFTFLFTLLNGTTEIWTFPIATYNYYLSLARIDPIIRLNDTITGKTIYTYDYRGTITPSFFANVTPVLTRGKTAGQFVAEVQNINNQLVNYSLIFENTSVYPAQLLAQGYGDCKDKGVLMASILEAGNIQANYGMKIQFVYVDADNLTAPRTANHLMLFITFANGTTEFLDTTHVLATTPYFNGTVDGWYYNLTCTMNGCQTVPLCTGSYCDAVGYVSGSSSSFNTCQSGYVVGSDSLCHLQSGGIDYYYAGGYSSTTLPTTTVQSSTSTCIAQAGFLCNNAILSSVTGYLNVTLGQATGTNWVNVSLVFVPQGSLSQGEIPSFNSAEVYTYLNSGYSYYFNLPVGYVSRGSTISGTIWAKYHIGYGSTSYYTQMATVQLTAN